MFALYRGDAFASPWRRRPKPDWRTRYPPLVGGSCGARANPKRKRGRARLRVGRAGRAQVSISSGDIPGRNEKLPRKMPRSLSHRYPRRQAYSQNLYGSVRPFYPSNLPPHLYKCGGRARAGFFIGGFIPAFARCCFCIAASLLVLTSPIMCASLIFPTSEKGTTSA